jgi:Raf kinase inhibitor-like YbhB/YbcL family protein
MIKIPKKPLTTLLFIATPLFSVGGPSMAEQEHATVENQLSLTSPAFKHGKSIPSMYSCDGEDVSPPLKWSEPPKGTVSFGLLVDDPDAPGRTWVHWVMFNIPPEKRELKENVEKKSQLPNGTRQGLNDFGRSGYGGPCPPGSTHRYFFRLYALDDKFQLSHHATKSDVMKAMDGHILGTGELMGTYSRR